MSKINAGTLAELFEAFPNAAVLVNGFFDIHIEFGVDPDGKPEFYLDEMDLHEKTAEPETQGGQK